MQSLTVQQEKLLSYIRDRIKSSGVAPSFEEMAQHMDLRSKSGIHRIITGLEARRRIYRPYGKARCIELIEDVDLSEVEADTLLDELRRRGFKFGRISYGK